MLCLHLKNSREPVFSSLHQRSGCIHRHAALESRIIVGYVTSASVLYMAARALLSTKSGRRLRSRLFSTAPEDAHDTSVNEGFYVTKHGGPTILAFQLCRAFANAGLFGLALYAAISGRGKSWGLNTIAMTSVGTLRLTQFMRANAGFHRRIRLFFPLSCCLCLSHSQERCLSKLPSSHSPSSPLTHIETSGR
jgi:hypothetical protein